MSKVGIKLAGTTIVVDSDSYNNVGSIAINPFGALTIDAVLIGAFAGIPTGMYFFAASLCGLGPIGGAIAGALSLGVVAGGLFKDVEMTVIQDSLMFGADVIASPTVVATDAVYELALKIAEKINIAGEATQSE